MTVYKIIRKKQILFYLTFSLFFCFILLFYGKESSRGALEGLMFCGKILIPSLFPFMVLSSFIAKCGIINFFAPFLKKTMGFLFGISGQGCVAVILSLIGGYPVGARTIEQLFKENLISEKEAEKLSYFCVGAGPGFLITFVGCNLFNCKKIGVILFMAQVISVVLLGIINNLFYKEKFFLNKFPTANKNSFSFTLVQSVKDGCSAAVSMCAIVMLFSAVTEVAYCIFPNNYIYIFLEVTSACNNLCHKAAIELIGFSVGFGGLCVHFQIFDGLKDIFFSKIKFFIFRVMQGIITAFLTYILLMIFPVTDSVFSNIKEPISAQNASSIWGSAALIITSVIFLFSIKQTKTYGR